MIAAIIRLWSHRNLWRGRCPQCGTVLRDDAPAGSLCGSPICSELDWQAAQ